ncbi:hypothetical protein ANTHELSMS3_03090 [Antarctobacter heliothermus]|uniref:Lipoprotein n=1 Tax=Antarctobacter heliothermus TaxID=74033 RepID=A0A222E6F7_9RHOB|nr:hypothetical protein [Antarctobacter heliothermus]ASP21742.1 hypothetical protein ANTHELSMS3_03090 [Antarctobacter heliothermus]MBT55905.1 hypothetical protein [Mameliella sp.]|tara:strand:- start:1949 stop:2293 length:345 start_codon:yes stop_codon:yes gene_type:complete
MMVRVICILAVAATLGGCERAGMFKRNAPVFDGERFRTTAKSERKNRQDFVINVSGVSKSMKGAIAAGEYKAVQHCIEFFGTSEIDWIVGPDTDPQALVVTGDNITFRGTCRDI